MAGRGLSAEALQKYDEQLAQIEAVLSGAVPHVDFSDGRSGDVVDAASHDALLDMTLLLGNNTAETRRRVELGRQRIRDGVFAVCEDCGKQVGQARLDAMPYAEKCIGCQRKAEAR